MEQAVSTGVTALPSGAVGAITTMSNIAGISGMANVQGIWYNYTQDAVGQILSAAGGPPVQVELDSTDLTHQFNQQVQTQFGNVQLQVVTAPPTPIAIPKEEPEMILPDVIKPCKVRSRQAGSERVPCLECGKTVSCNATLRDHMRTHTGERPFVCSECGLAFAQRSNLRMHKRLHTGERPYMCGICGKTFARSSHLPAHMRTHTGEKPYICEECNHAFITAQQLKNHFRVHTGEKPWKCDQCNAAFTHSSSLSTHRKKHTGQKPYQCEKCRKSFFFTSALDKHMKVHSKARPFKCDTCDKAFKYKESLTVHIDKYCGKEIAKRPRAKRKPDARKPGPKPGSGRKYMQKRRGKPRGRPRKRGRWSKRKVIRRNYRHMEDGDGEGDEQLEDMDKPQQLFGDIMEDDQETKPEGIELPRIEEEDIPIAELKVEEVLNSENGLVLTEHITNHGEELHHHPIPVHTLGNAHTAHEIRIDDATALTIVSAEEAEQHIAAGGVQLLALPSDLPIHLIQHHASGASAGAVEQSVTHQFLTRDGIQMWYPRQFQ